MSNRQKSICAKRQQIGSHRFDRKSSETSTSTLEAVAICPHNGDSVDARVERILPTQATLHGVSKYALADALDSTSDALWDFDLRNQVIRISGGWLSILYHGEADISHPVRKWHGLLNIADLHDMKTALIKHLRGQTKKFACEFKMQTGDGSIAWALACGKVSDRDADGHAVRMVGTLLDITQRKLAEQSVAHSASHDALTDLPNRTLFESRLRLELDLTRRNAGLFAVLACDLDKFKLVNDTLGHAAGDDLLRIVAQRMKEVIREGDTLARLGGDEFVVLLRRLDNKHEAAGFADRIIASIARPIEVAASRVVVGMSIGVAIGSCDASDDLLEKADQALYKAKLSGRNNHKFFDAELEASATSRRRMGVDLLAAIEKNEIALHYQPMIDLVGSTVVGLEALMRWQGEDRAPVSPAIFLPVAEENGVMTALGGWALMEACRQAVTWPEHLKIAVNMSATQFHRPAQLLFDVSAALISSGIAPSRLELEVNEALLAENTEAVLASLRDLRSLGVRICLDDFGTGHSGLTYLRRFPFDKIKIDQSLVREAADPVVAAIVKAISGLATRIGADVLAEGVETLDQLDFIRQAGCTQMQGFFESEPLSLIGDTDFRVWEEQRSRHKGPSVFAS